jgi:hypothetical protein
MARSGAWLSTGCWAIGETSGKLGGFPTQCLRPRRCEGSGRRRNQQVARWTLANIYRLAGFDELKYCRRH